MNFGFVGLGAMIAAMASNLVAAGQQVCAWNRSETRIIEEVTMVSDPVDAFQGDATLTVLSDDPAIRSVLFDAGVLERARRSSSTS